MDKSNILLYGSAIVVSATVVLSSLTAEPQPRQLDELDLLLEKSKQNMSKASQIAKAIDEATTTQVTELKTSVEVLTQEKQQLTTQLHETKVLLDPTLGTGAAYRLEPILPDSTSNR